MFSFSWKGERGGSYFLNKILKTNFTHQIFLTSSCFVTGKGTRGNNPRIEEIDPSELDIREEEGGDRPIEETDEEVPVDTRRTRAPR